MPTTLSHLFSQVYLSGLRLRYSILYRLTPLSFGERVQGFSVLAVSCSIFYVYPPSSHK